MPPCFPTSQKRDPSAALRAGCGAAMFVWIDVSRWDSSRPYGPDWRFCVGSEFPGFHPQPHEQRPVLAPATKTRRRGPRVFVGTPAWAIFMFSLRENWLRSRCLWWRAMKRRFGFVLSHISSHKVCGRRYGAPMVSQIDAMQKTKADPSPPRLRHPMNDSRRSRGPKRAGSQDDNG
jgi:hypothetical protein